jgi:high-affinity iron transporter
MNFSTALPTFVVTLREGFEAALVVGIVVACLEKVRQSQLYRFVYLGVAAGIVASIIVGSFLWGTIQGVSASENYYAPVIQQLLEGIFSLVAIVMLSWMLIWMSRQAKSLKGEVEGAINSALNQQNAGRGVFLLVFIAVLREGLETVLFIVAKFQTEIIPPVIGAMLGLILAAAMGWALFYWGIKLNIRLFFQIMGIFLLLIVDGLVIGTLRHFDIAVNLLGQLNPNYSNWCLFQQGACLLGQRVWDGTNTLPDHQFPGILLKTLFGYREQIYTVQLIAYGLFLAIVGGLYLFSLKPKSSS